MKGPRVKCVVDTCTHWLPGQLCSAREIDIMHEEEGRMAEIVEHTQCKTFHKKDNLADWLGSVDNVNWGGVVTGLFRTGQQINPQVMCTVHSCKYWESENRCIAEAIEVSGRDARECQDTNCATFRNKKTSDMAAGPVGYLREEQEDDPAEVESRQGDADTHDVQTD